jgi:hypothetical protein
MQISLMVLMSRRGTKPLPAFIVDIIFAKYYLITTGKLLAAVQRNNKSISFEPLLTPMSERMAGIKGKSLDILTSKVAPEGPMLMTRNLHAIHPHLLGDGLNAMNRRMIGFLKVSLDNLSEKSETFDMYRGVRHAVSIATTDAVYGAQNPYRDPNVEQGFWYVFPFIQPVFWLTP